MRPTTKLVRLVPGLLIAAALLGSPANAAAEGSTAFCEVPQAPCEEGNLYPAKTSIQATASSLRFLSDIDTIECEEAHLELETSAALANPLQTTVRELQTLSTLCFGEAGQWCVVTAKPEGIPASFGSVAFLASGTEFNASAELTGMSIRLECSAIGTCLITVSNEQPGLMQFSPEPATLSANEIEFTLTSGLFCPETWLLDAQFEITSPLPLYTSS